MMENVNEASRLIAKSKETLIFYLTDKNYYNEATLKECLLLLDEALEKLT